jgi:hypothetical protein
MLHATRRVNFPAFVPMNGDTMTIRFQCPKCGQSLAADESAVGRQARCRCGEFVDVPMLLALAPTENNRLSVRLRYATVVADVGRVVGLEKSSEQYVSGDAFIAGSQHISGSYDGGHGSISGFGWLGGSAKTRTHYRYKTSFFMRRSDGSDQPFCIIGEHLPLLDGHAIASVHAINDDRDSLLCALVNFNTRQTFTTTRSSELIDHLGIPRRVRTQELVLSPESRKLRIAEHFRKYESMLPWMTLALTIGIAVMAMLGLVAGTTGLNGLGFAALLVAGVLTASLSGIVIFIQVRGNRLKHLPTHQTRFIKNREIEEELDGIRDFVERVARLKC